ncbi:hypothetical protein SDC9_170977 [bioreactor metagenome]|uniref:Uncharacterized protein n=1 Tax=bioreactor metagenome TaxID=1076179 RepID=A0A645GAB7_9ZZZZ
MGRTGGFQQLRHIGRKIFGQERAVLFGEGKQALFAGVEHAVEGKEDVKVAGQQSCHAVIYANKVATALRLLDLMGIRGDDPA